MDGTERALLRDAVERALADAVEATDAPGTADTALHGLGWHEMLTTETSDALGIVFESLGRTGAAATVLDDVLALGLGVEPRDDLAVLVPPFGESAPPRLPAVGAPASVVAWGATGRAGIADELLLACDLDGTLQLATLPRTAVRARAVRGIDPDAAVHAIELERDGVADVTPISFETWAHVLALGRRALAHQMLGASRTMLDLARVHALERVQFGRPIAGFQAVRHRLADALVAIESLDATLAGAADAPGAETAALAKAVAGRTARTVASHCQQVLAGIGFTTDHPFHRYLKRTMLLDGLLGTADAIVVDLGRQLLEHRHVPTLVEL